MNRIQELIKEYGKNKDKGTYRDILAEIQTGEVLYSAFSPVTRGHFVDYVEGIPSAFLFSEKQYCEDFCHHIKENGYTVGIAECKKDSRLSMLSDYHRSGIESVLIDNGKAHILIPLSDLINVPDFSKIPENQRPIINPTFVCSANRFFQCIENKTVTPDKEINFLSDAYNARYIIPVEGKPEGNKVNIPSIGRNDGEKVIPFFTDIDEYRKLDHENKFTPMPATFAHIENLCNENEIVVINPFGFNFTITKETCEAIHKAIKLAPQTEGERAVIYTLERVPTDVTDRLSKLCDADGRVVKAFIKGLRKKNGSELLVTLDCGDAEEDEVKAILNEIKTEIEKYTDKPISIASVGSYIGKLASSETVPFFEKFTVDVNVPPENFDIGE